MKLSHPSSIKEIDLSKLYNLCHRVLQNNTLDTILKKNLETILEECNPNNIFIWVSTNYLSCSSSA